MRALAVTTAQRWPELTDLPAVAKTVPGYEHTSPEEFSRIIQRNIAKWSKVVKA